MAMDRIESYIDGVVSRANERGFTLEDRDGWLNLSKFSDGVTVPAAGELVRVGLDKAGFVRCVEVVADAPKHAAASPETGSSGPVDKDRRIVRMNCVANAIALCTAGGGVSDIDTVIEVAEQFEEWVTR